MPPPLNPPTQTGLRLRHLRSTHLRVYVLVVYQGGGWGEGLGRAPNIHHKRLTPDPLARGQLITVCGGGGGTGPRAKCVCELGYSYI